MCATRRTLLKTALAGTAVAIAVKMGLLKPRSALAEWPWSAFGAKSSQEALTELFGEAAITENDKVQIEVMALAGNGAVVPATINASLDDVESITIIAEKNPVPLVASFNLASTANPFVATRIRLAESSNVIAVVKAKGALYSARKFVKVVVGGCE